MKRRSFVHLRTLDRLSGGNARVALAQVATGARRCRASPARPIPTTCSWSCSMSGGNDGLNTIVPTATTRIIACGPRSAFRRRPC